jgi:uncharacterized YccA/Bax inhibitor family protein
MAFKLGLMTVAAFIAQLLVGSFAGALSIVSSLPAAVFGACAMTAVLVLEAGVGAEIFLARAMNRPVALDRMLTRFGALLALSLITTLLLFAGVLLLSIPVSALVEHGLVGGMILALVGGATGMWIWTRLSFAIYWVLEGATPGDALAASWRFSRDERSLCVSWFISGLAVGLALIVSAWGLNGFFAPDLYTGSDDQRELVFLLVAIGSAIASIAASLFFGTAHAMIYACMRPVTWAEGDSASQIERQSVACA